MHACMHARTQAGLFNYIFSPGFVFTLGYTFVTEHVLNSARKISVSLGL